MGPRLNHLPGGRLVLILVTMVSGSLLWAQKDYIDRKSLEINVNAIDFSLTTLMGDGGMASMYSWNLTGDRKEETEEWYFPQDRYYSNMLFHLYNIICYDDSGYVDREGQRHSRVWLRSEGFRTDYSWERRRYAPPAIIVDDVYLTPPYRWELDPTVPTDLVASFEDIYRNFELSQGYGGIRVKVNVYAMSNPNHDDYIIWEQTMIFTGELYRASEVDGGVITEEHLLPDQTVRLWWSFTPGFGPTKSGEEAAIGWFGYEPIDDLDSWLAAPSVLVPNRDRDSLHIGYYWDTHSEYAAANEWPSADDSGDPDRVNGHLYSTQIPGYTLLEVIPPGQTNDDLTQPYAMPHANINDHFFGQRTNFGMRDQYIGHALHGKWPRDLRTEYGPNTKPDKGPLRVTALGPYELTKDASIGRYDSIKVVWAIGVGDVGYDVADSLGKAWFQGVITDEEKNTFIDMGRDSLIQVLDRANWAWNVGLENVPAPPPPPDLVVTSGPQYNTVEWSYPDPDYYLDPHTGVDDWYAWRIYRKEGAYYVDDPDDDYRYYQWEFVEEITDRNQTAWHDTTARRGTSYYYAVTAVDDGSQNTTGLFPGQKLESSRYANRSRQPAITFEPGLNETDRVRVVPNPYTVAGGYMTFSGERDKVLFVNLPIEATLSIYTESGELIKRFEHYGTADNSWDLRTEYRQLVASGLYVLLVHNAKDIEGNSLPDQFVKFVIIR